MPADVRATEKSSPDPIKYAPVDMSGRGRNRVETDSQAEGRGFESRFPLQIYQGFPALRGEIPKETDLWFRGDQVKPHWGILPLY